MPFLKTFRSVWLWSLGFFALAALTGAFYRLGLIGGLPLDLSLTNVRHAHSHLMFFNWVTPIPMIFIAGYVIQQAPGAVKSFKQCIATVLVIGFASFPFFLFNGYEPVQVGGASLPFSVILSGMVMVTWYWFCWIYLKNREKTGGGLPGMFYDASLLLLVVSSLGAWGIAVFQFSGIENPLLSTALTHFFLTVFIEGWTVLSALGIIYHTLGIHRGRLHESWLIGPIVLGVPLMFPFGISAELLTNELLITASFGAIIVTVGLAANFYQLMRSIRWPITWWWIVVLNLLAAKILIQFGAAVLPFDFLLGQHGLRVFYLHLTLLGVVSLIYFSAWHSMLTHVKKGAFKLFVLSVLILLGMLLWISGLLPATLIPGRVYEVLFIVSLFPGLFVLLEGWYLYKEMNSGK